MQLEEILLQNFKGFKNYKLKLKQFNVLIGENNSGKTTLLQAIQLVYDSINFLFGKGEHPRFTGISWKSDLRPQISRLGVIDRDLLFFKKVPEGLQISAKWDNGLQMNFNTIQKDVFKFELLENGKSISNNINDPHVQELIKSVYSIRAFLLPPVSTISPDEPFITRPDMDSRQAQGRYNETWRGNLFWTYNSGDKTVFDEFSESIRAYLPGSNVLPPRLSEDGTAKFIIEYSANSEKYDISSGGGGLRTLISLVSILKLAKASCILLDEPDAHLHSGLQRSIAEMLLDYAESQNVQIVIATHSPDIIDSVPLNSLLHIDRMQNEPSIPDNVGSVLVSLGAMTNSQAIAISGASTIINIEGNADKIVLTEFAKQNKEAFPPNLHARVVKAGKKNISELEHIYHGILDYLKIKIKIAAINDRDYDSLIDVQEDIKKEEREGILLLTLGRKEIENYLLDAKAISEAINFQIQKRQSKSNEDSLSDVKSIQSIINESIEKYKETISYKLKPLIRKGLLKEWDDTKKEEEAEKQFNEMWANEEWRILVCPGKSILRSVRAEIHKRWKVTITDQLISQFIAPIPEDIITVLKSIKEFHSKWL